MLPVTIETHPSLYVDYKKGVDYLKTIKDERFSYPDELSLFHVYTEFRNPKELLVLTSYLATQHLRKTKLIIWSDYDISDHPGIQPYKDLSCLDFRIYDPIEEAKGTPLEGTKQLSQVDKKYYLASDLLRLLAGYKYGGTWVDMDIVFLRDFKPLLGQEYMYQWGDETNFSVEGACATVISLTKESELSKELLKELLISPPIPNSTSWGKDLFASLWRRYPKFFILPSSFFNTCLLYTSPSPRD